jgi:zinc protease
MRRLALALLCVCGLTGSPAAADLYHPETFTLQNGLEVIIIPNHRAPVVTQMVWYKVGSADEPVGKSGIAHYLEHLMFKGTKTRKAGDYSALIARHGGKENAFTAWDYTAYFATVGRDSLPLVMALEADRMANLSPKAGEAATELKVVLAERAQRTDNVPEGMLQEAVLSSLFVHHPYGRPIIGWRGEIERLTLADALDFYRRWYAPGNAVLVLSGDIDAKTARPLIDKTFGRIPARAVPPRLRVTEPVLLPDRHVTLADPRVSQPSLLRVYQAPSARLPQGVSIPALDVLKAVLAGESGRFYQHLVIEKKLAVSVHFDVDSVAYDLGTAGFQLVPADGVTLDALDQALSDELAALLDQGVGEDDVARAKAALLRRAELGRDSVMGPAYAFGLARTTGQTVADVESWPDRIGRVTVADVTAAAKAVFGKDGKTSGFVRADLIPDSTAPRPPEADGPMLDLQGAIR